MAESASPTARRLSARSRRASTARFSWFVRSAPAMNKAHTTQMMVTLIFLFSLFTFILHSLICHSSFFILHLFCLPLGDVAVSGAEGDADLGDGAAVEGVFVGIATLAELVEGSSGGVIVL